MLEELILPWWKIPIYILTTLIGIAAIKVTVKFDVNEWRRERRKQKLLKAQHKRIESCRHVWTLYDSSEFSQCNKCMVLISTSILLMAMNAQVDDVRIYTVHTGVMISTKGEVLYTDDPIGKLN